MKKSPLLLVCFVSITLIMFRPPSYGQSGAQVVPFPEWKGEILGAASHAALFGHNGDNSVSSSSSPPLSSSGGRPPNISPNTPVNGPQALAPNGLIGRSETTLSVSGQGNFLVAGWNDAQGFCSPPFNSLACPAAPAHIGLSGYGFSRDGGDTWTDGGTPFLSGSPDPAFPQCGGIVTRGDPWLDAGGHGNDTVYYSNLAVYQTPAGHPDCSTATFVTTAGISVHRGNFQANGFGWNDVFLLKPQAGIGLAVGFPLDFYDKESLAADKNGSRRHVFVSVTNFVGRIQTPPLPNIAGCGFGQIELWRSLNGASSWGAAPTLVQIDQVSLTDCGTGRLNQGSQVAVGPDGTAYVAWQNGPDFLAGATVTPLDVDIMAANCGFAGTGPCTVGTVASIGSLRLSAPQGYNRNRLQDFPRVAVAQTGTHRGRVYVVYASGTGTPVAPGPVFADFDILLKFSDNGGATWQGPVNVNPPSDGKKDFWPVVSVDQNGNVDVVYVSSDEANVTAPTSDIECIPAAKQAGGGISQNGTRSSIVDIFWAQSLDGGATFQAPMKVTEVSSNWCKARSNIRPAFGDYIDGDSFGNRVFVSWADGRLPAPAPDTLAPPGGPRTFEPDVFYATIRAIGRAPR